MLSGEEQKQNQVGRCCGVREVLGGVAVLGRCLEVLLCYGGVAVRAALPGDQRYLRRRWAARARLADREVLSYQGGGALLGRRCLIRESFPY